MLLVHAAHGRASPAFKLRLLLPLHTLEPLVKVILPRVILFILCDPAQALGTRIWQVTLNLFTIGVGRPSWRNLELHNMTADAQWQFAHCRILLLLHLAGGWRRLQHALLVCHLMVMRQDLIDQVVRIASLAAILSFFFLSLLALLFFGLSVASKFFNLCASLCSCDHFLCSDSDRSI